MALTQPILYTMAAFDATQEQTFTFNVIGGDRVVSNKLTIKNNNTLATVYEQTSTTFAFAHTVPANTLTNGVYYQAYVTTYDGNGGMSVPSNTIQFYCYSEPSYQFINLPSTKIIDSSSFNFQVQYFQNEYEPLTSYTFNLYDDDMRQIATSGVMYTSSTIVPFEVNYTFSGLVDGTVYYVECTGLTSGNTQISTGFVQISVSYSKPSSYATLELTNNCNDGYIYVQSRAIAIMGNSYPSPPIYVDNNTAVNLKGSTAYVGWDSGYSIDGNFTMSIWGRDFNINKTICEWIPSNNFHGIINLIQEDNKVYAKLEAYKVAYSNRFGYVTYSNGIDIPLSTDELNIWVRYIDGLYEVKLANLS